MARKEVEKPKEAATAEPKQAEEDLRKYKWIVESAQDAIFFKDLESRYTLVNAKTARVFGLSCEEIVGKTDYELMSDKEQARRNVEEDRVVFKTGKPLETIKPIARADGKEYWFHTIKVPQFDDEETIKGLAGIARDITDRKKAEEELRQRTEEMEKILKCAIDRELRMIEMKKEINELRTKLNKEAKGR